MVSDLIEQGQAGGQINPDLDPLQLAELYTAVITLTATNWLINWWGEIDQPLDERLLSALAVILDGARSKQ